MFLLEVNEYFSCCVIKHSENLEPISHQMVKISFVLPLFSSGGLVQNFVNQKQQYFTPRNTQPYCFFEVSQGVCNHPLKNYGFV